MTRRGSDDISLNRRGVRLIKELVAVSPTTFAVSVFGSAVFAGATVASTLVLGRVTDDVVLATFETGTVPPGALPWSVAAIVAVTVIRSAGVVLRRYFAAMTAERAQVGLRRSLADRYLSLPLSWHQEAPAGQLLAHAESDAEVTAEVLHPLPFSLGVAFLALFSAVALLVVDPFLAAVALLIFPALTLLNRAYSARVEQPAAEVQAGVGRVASVAHESFDGALVVKTLGRAEAEQDRFSEAAIELRQRRQEVGFIRAMFESAMDALPNLGIVAVVVVGSVRINAGAMTEGDLVQVASLFTVLAMPMRVFGFFLEMLPPSVVARSRLEGVFANEVDAGPTEPKGLPAGPLRVVASDLHYRYDDEQRVLDGVELALEPGEVVALVGSTGSGKSTLCLVLAGLLPPSEGRVLVGGVPIDELTAAERTETVALVFQESFLFADSIQANVALELPAELDAEAVESALAVAKADFVNELSNGLDTVVGERGVTLSGGQRQRVALARALVRRPRFLLLDDATSAVDPVVEQQILAGLGDRLDTTTLIVAQRVSTIELADRVLYLSGGQIVAAGTHAELLAVPGYAALVHAYEATS